MAKRKRPKVSLFENASEFHINQVNTTIIRNLNIQMSSSNPSESSKTPYFRGFVAGFGSCAILSGLF